MTEMLRKRGCEHEVLPGFIEVQGSKRLHAEKTDWLFHLQQFDKTLADEEDEQHAPSEEIVNGLMKSLEKEIAETSSTSCLFSNFGNYSAPLDISSGHAGQTLASNSGIDLCYLLEASDDELGIPPSPVLNWKDEFCQSLNETSEGLWESPDLKFLDENAWHAVYDNDFENYQQYGVYEDAWDASEDYMNREFVSQVMLIDADFSANWTLETASSLLP